MWQNFCVSQRVCAQAYILSIPAQTATVRRRKIVENHQNRRRQANSWRPGVIPWVRRQMWRDRSAFPTINGRDIRCLKVAVDTKYQREFSQGGRAPTNYELPLGPHCPAPVGR